MKKKAFLFSEVRMNQILHVSICQAKSLHPVNVKNAITMLSVFKGNASARQVTLVMDSTAAVSTSNSELTLNISLTIING